MVMVCFIVHLRSNRKLRTTKSSFIRKKEKKATKSSRMLRFAT